MKIAVLSSHTPSLFWFRMDMMQSFLSLGHEVVAVGNEPESIWKEKFENKNIKYIKANIQRNGINPLNDLKTLFSLKKILEMEKPDKIFTYQAKTVIYGCIAARTLGIKHIYPLIAGIGSVFLSNSFKSRIIRFILKSEYRAALHNVSNIFFQNNDDVEVFVKNKIIKKDAVVMLNGSGVNLEKFKKSPLPKECVFLCVARIIRDKGIIEYLNASKKVKSQYPNIRFMLVGPYDSNPSALTQKDIIPFIENGIIEYYGEQNDVFPYLKQCSVFVLPSYREGTPKTVLEAMAVGRAVITTNAPGCRETVADGENGYLIPIKDEKALVDKMVLLINSPEVVSKMADKGREIAKNKYDVIKVNEKIINTMELCVNERKSNYVTL